MRRVARWAAVVVGGLVAVALLYVGVTALQVYRAAQWDERSDADAIVVLGAAQYDGRPSPALKRRLNHAYELYKDHVAPEIVVTGAAKPGDRFTEAYAGLKYLIAKGVPEKDIVAVTTGRSTYESVAAARRQLRKSGANRIVLVSDPSHSLRLGAVADEVGFDPLLSPSDAPVTWANLRRETFAVAVGRLVGYRRLSHVTNP